MFLHFLLVSIYFYSKFSSCLPHQNVHDFWYTNNNTSSAGSSLSKSNKKAKKNYNSNTTRRYALSSKKLDTGKSSKSYKHTISPNVFIISSTIPVSDKNNSTNVSLAIPNTLVTNVSSLLKSNKKSKKSYNNTTRRYALSSKKVSTGKSSKSYKHTTSTDVFTISSSEPSSYKNISSNMSLFIPSTLVVNKSSYIFVPTLAPPSKSLPSDLLFKNRFLNHSSARSNYVHTLDHLKHGSSVSPLTSGSISKSEDQVNTGDDDERDKVTVAAIVLSGTMMMFFAMFALYRNYMQRAN